MHKLNRLMEHFWLALAIATLAVALWTIISEGWNKGAQWLVLPAIATAAWLMRRFVRKRLGSAPRN
ncbi:MAG: hypothetical protein IPJ85_15360 [Flavobacteriales bacterium]|nr:hypothetical protein [Flavobacteriales bacterium]